MGVLVCCEKVSDDPKAKVKLWSFGYSVISLIGSKVLMYLTNITL